jgi:hypothetical protein
VHNWVTGSVGNGSEIPTNEIVPKHYVYNELIDEFRDSGGSPIDCPDIEYGRVIAKDQVELDWDTFLRRKLSNNGADKTKGWIKPNPVDSAPSKSGKDFPTFDRTIDGIDSEYFNPKSTGNALRDRIKDKLADCITKKKCKRIYIDLTGKEGNLDDLIRSCMLGQATKHPEVQTLVIFYRVGNDLIQFNL